VESASPAIVLRNLRRSFGEVKAVDGVNLEIENGEFFAMLGPSGSGKTTVLRLIAGFEIPDSGEIEIAGANVSNVPPFNRDVPPLPRALLSTPCLSGSSITSSAQTKRQLLT